ncbi:DUF1542 domain-containing protein, partial [Erysipelothrix rhusiopathiae]|nr:DUF1542 domain-containing protein [Erysipelothrix rhusiopathiae]
VSDVTLVDRKNDSKSDLDKKAKDAKNEIDKLPNLTDDEKQKAFHHPLNLVTYRFHS